MYLRRKMQSQSSRRLDTPRLWMLYSSLLDMSKGMPDMTPEELAAFRAEDRSGEVYIIHTIFFVLAILSVFARLGAARHSGRKIGWDDWLAVASLIFIMGVFTGTMFWLKFGLGRHAIVVQEEDPMNITHFYQTIFANEILYPMGLATARLSLVILYHRIFGLFSARYYLYGLMAFIGAWAVYAVSTFDYSDPTWGTVDLMIWTGLEAYCSFKDTDRNPGDVSQPEVYLKMPPQIASRSSEEALEEYDFVKMSLADLQQYSRRLTMGESGSIPNAVAYRQ
ncbi:integral membrane protein [Colletotrichum tofieldiae]|nr:integral membrane protein [Colletotrichum tofieldiae]